MRTYLIAFLFAAVVTVLVTPLVRRLAPSMGAVDPPSGRRVNERVIPRLGGIAILVGFLAPLVGLLFVENDIARHLLENRSRACAAFGGALAMSLLGVADDLRGLRARYKLLIQMAVAVGAWAAGFRIEEVALPFLGAFDTAWLSLPLTVAWIVGIVNAVNLIDGLDGLAAGVAFMVCVVNFVVGSISDHLLVALFSSALGGALIGFLVFNFNPARIFMGDSGSMFVGYVLATTSLVGSKGSTAVALLVPILALGLPIMDTLWAIARRIARRRPVFAPDGEHIHHRLVKRGLSHRGAVLVLYGVSVVLTTAALVVYIGRDWEVGAVLTVSAVVIFGLVRSARAFQVRGDRGGEEHSRYLEDADLIRGAIPALYDDLSAASGPGDLRGALESFARAAGIAQVEVDGEGAGDLGPFEWSAAARSDPAAGLARGHVSASYTVGDGGRGRIEFGWRSDSGYVSAQCEIMLRLAVDMLERRRAELEAAARGVDRAASGVDG